VKKYRNWFFLILFLLTLIMSANWSPAGAAANQPERVVQFNGAYDAIYIYCYNGETYEGCPDSRIPIFDGGLRWLRIGHPSSYNLLTVEMCTYPGHFECTAQVLSPNVLYPEYGDRPEMIWHPMDEVVIVRSPWGGGYERVMLPYNIYTPFNAPGNSLP
jgi:hypothetical protein